MDFSAARAYTIQKIHDTPDSCDYTVAPKQVRFRFNTRHPKTLILTQGATRFFEGCPEVRGDK